MIDISRFCNPLLSDKNASMAMQRFYLSIKKSIINHIYLYFRYAIGFPNVFIRNALPVFILAIVSFIVSSCVKTTDDDPQTTNNIEILISEVVFDYDENSQYLSLKNVSNESVEFYLDSNDDFIVIQSKYGSLQANETKEISFFINRTLLFADSVKSQIQFTSGNESKDIPITIFHKAETKIKYRYPIGYAAFSQELNRLFYRLNDENSNSNILYTYDLDEEIITEIEMPFYFRKIHIIQEYNKLVLHSLSHIYVLDLDTYTIDFDIDLSYSVGDIIYLSDRMYIFPHSTGYYAYQTYIFQSAELNMYGFNDDYDYSYFDAHLHPSGKYFYAYNMHSSEKNLVRYGVESETYSHYYSQIVDGISKRIWLSEDGSKLFSTQNTYFEIVPNSPEFDLVAHDFVLPVEGTVKCISGSSTRKEYYLSMETEDHTHENTIYIYDENINYKSSIKTEDYYQFSTSYNPPAFLYEGHIKELFYSQKSDAFVVITAPNGSNHSCGIEIIDL